MTGVNLAATASLAVAALDLLLVQDLIGAMRAADAGAQAACSSPLAPLPTPEPRRHIHPEPVYEPRRVIHPSPCYARCREPQPMLHALPRVAIPASPRVECATHSEATGPRESKLAMPPPWEVKDPIKPAARVKVVIYRTDILSKGSLIDMFI